MHCLNATVVRLRCGASARAVATAAKNKSGYGHGMTKVVCTLGPSSETAERVQELCDGGMSCSRLNFSHVGSYDEPAEKMGLVRAAKGVHTLLEEPLIRSGSVPPNLRAVLVDTKGPEVRTGPLPGGADVREIAAGETVLLTHDDVAGDAADATLRLHVDYAALPQTVAVGGLVLLDDGLVGLRVEKIEGSTVVCVAENGGPIKARKGVNLPGAKLDLPALTAKDKGDLAWAVENGADFIALSFVRSAANVRTCRAFLERCRGDAADTTPLPSIISKIENAEGVEHFDAILEASDGIMVARGDLGVEIAFEKVFAAQRMMVAACNEAGKPVIVATQMLDSMMRSPRPTRAEVTDVASAVLDGADAVMLSGETAAGAYPLEALAAMRAVCAEADAIVDAGDGFDRRPRPLDDEELDAVARGAVSAASRLGAKMISCITLTGSLARALARHRPTRPVVAFCFDAAVARKLQLHRGVFPILLDACVDASNPYADGGTKMSVLRSESVRTCKELGYVAEGDVVVAVDRSRGKTGDTFALGTNMKVFKVTA